LEDWRFRLHCTFLEKMVSAGVSVFISWSGENSKSHKTALLLKQWIPNVIQGEDPWVSSVDIEAGSRWTNELFGVLQSQSIKVGIICVTQGNQSNPWLNFEAGILAHAVESRVCPLLIDLRAADVTSPLNQFQMHSLSKEGVFPVLKVINKHRSPTLSEGALEKALNKWWDDDFEAEKATIISSKEPPKSARDQREILEEILNIVRMPPRTFAQKLASLSPDQLESVGQELFFNALSSSNWKDKLQPAAREAQAAADAAEREEKPRVRANSSVSRQDIPTGET